MMYITHVRLGWSGSTHQHITHLRWRDPAGGVGTTTRADMVSWIERGGAAQVLRLGAPAASVGVVNAFPSKYVQTHADGIWTNNLLALPRF